MDVNGGRYSDMIENGIIDAKKLRHVAGAFATGVTVVATRKEGEVVGMTANSFVSVSLSPPLVMFSVQKKGGFHELCEVGAEMGISILAASQKEVSDHFAGFGTKDKVEVSFLHPTGAPVLKNSVAWYKTTVSQLIDGGDHTLILCKVNDLHRDEDATPLLYYQGYHTLGRKVIS